MRKYIILFLMALCVATGCATFRAPAKLDRLANRVERRADRYTLNDWQRANSKYESLIREYVQNYGSYTRAEKQKAMAAIGRYNGVLVDYGIKEGVGVVEGIGAYAGGLLDILKEDVNAVKDFLRDVLSLDNKQINKFLEEAK